MKLTDENQDYMDSRPIDLKGPVESTAAFDKVLRNRKIKRDNPKKPSTEAP